MDYKRKKYIYPNRYEIEQTLGEFAKRSFVDSFAQEKGIFITKANQNEFSNVLAGFFYDHDDLEKIRDTAYRGSLTQNLSGIIIHSEEGEFNPIVALKNIRDEGGLEQGMELSPVTLLAKENKDDNDIYKGEINYVKRKPGRIEFLQEENRAFDFTIEKLSEEEHLILVNSSRSGDSNIFEKLVKKKTSRTNARFEKMDQTFLNSEQTIKFFDDLAEKGLDKDWELVEVLQLVFRRGKDEEEEETVEGSQLAGISQAILEGKNLRENSFVKQSEEKGYRFTSMTYKFEHQEKASIIEIKAEFKFRPKVFEVNILESYLKEGIKETEVKRKLNTPEEMTIKTIFWREAKRIFSDLQKVE